MPSGDTEYQELNLYLNPEDEDDDDSDVPPLDEELDEDDWADWSEYIRDFD